MLRCVGPTRALHLRKYASMGRPTRVSQRKSPYVRGIPGRESRSAKWPMTRPHGSRTFSQSSASIATTVLSSIRWRSYRGVLHRQQFRELPICGGLSTRGQFPLCRIAADVRHLSRNRGHWRGASSNRGDLPPRKATV